MAQLRLNTGEVVEYEGEVDSDKLPHGYGKMWRLNGERYEGEFFEGKRHGKGKYFYPDGAYYEGESQNNMRHGYGVFVYPNRSFDAGIWKNGNLVEKHYENNEMCYLGENGEIRYRDPR